VRVEVSALRQLKAQREVLKLQCNDVFAIACPQRLRVANECKIANASKAMPCLSSSTPVSRNCSGTLAFQLNQW
jgi:hypothetical protein